MDLERRRGRARRLALVEHAVVGHVAARLGIDAQPQVGGARHQRVGIEQRRGRLLHRLAHRLVERALAGAHAIARDDRRLPERLEARLLRPGDPTA